MHPVGANYVLLSVLGEKMPLFYSVSKISRTYSWVMLQGLRLSNFFLLASIQLTVSSWATWIELTCDDSRKSACLSSLRIQIGLHWKDWRQGNVMNIIFPSQQVHHRAIFHFQLTAMLSSWWVWHFVLSNMFFLRLWNAEYKWPVICLCREVAWDTHSDMLVRKLSPFCTKIFPVFGFNFFPVFLPTGWGRKCIRKSQSYPPF